MAAITRAQTLDFSGDLPGEARSRITAELARAPASARKVYAALAHKVWSLLVERRFDDEIRDWHDLIHGMKAYIRGSDDAAAERLTALADLLRESISLAQTSPARDVARRPRARQILELLAKARVFVPRASLREEIGIGNSHLSNVLTQLLAHGLVDRREAGKAASYRITPLGRQFIGGDGMRQDDTAALPEPTRALAARVRQLDAARLHRSEEDMIAGAVVPGNMVVLNAGMSGLVGPVMPAYPTTGWRLSTHARVYGLAMSPDQTLQPHIRKISKYLTDAGMD